MIVDDLDLQHPALEEAKADAPLVVDTDAPLTLSVALEGLETVVRWNSQLFDSDNAIEDSEFAQRDRLEIPETCDPLALKQCFGVLTAEGLDCHAQMLSFCDTLVKRYLGSFLLAEQ